MESNPTRPPFTRLNYRRLWHNYLMPLAIVGGIILFAFFFTEVALYIVLAVMVSMLLRPVMEWLARRKLGRRRTPRPMAAGICLFGVVMVLAAILLLLVPTIVQEVSQITSIQLSEVEKRYAPELRRWDQFALEHGIVYTSDSLLQTFQNLREELVPEPGQLAEMAGSVLGVAGSVLVGLGSVLFMGYFFLVNPKLFPTIVLSLTPPQYSYRMMHVYYKIKWVVRRYFTGIIIQLSSFITLYVIGLSVLGVNNAIFLAVFSGLMNLVPYLGPLIALTMGCVLIIVSNLHTGFDELLWMLAKMVGTALTVQFLDNWIITPTVYSNSVKAHPMEIFLVILMGGHVAGIPGMILAVPTYTVLRILLREIFPHNEPIRRLTQNLENAIMSSRRNGSGGEA